MKLQLAILAIFVLSVESMALFSKTMQPLNAMVRGPASSVASAPALRDMKFSGTIKLDKEEEEEEEEPVTTEETTTTEKSRNFNVKIQGTVEKSEETWERQETTPPASTTAASSVVSTPPVSTGSTPPATTVAPA